MFYGELLSCYYNKKLPSASLILLAGSVVIETGKSMSGCSATPELQNTTLTKKNPKNIARCCKLPHNKRPWSHTHALCHNTLSHTQTPPLCTHTQRYTATSSDHTNTRLLNYAANTQAHILDERGFYKPHKQLFF